MVKNGVFRGFYGKKWGFGGVLGLKLHVLAFYGEKMGF
jgi:hypothetical protein